MLFPDLIDVPTEVFGGYCPAIPPADLSPGAASIAQDVIFPQGAVRSRGGLKNAFNVSPVPVNASINGLKSYITPSLAQRLMAWDSLGNLYKENPQGTLSQIFSRPYTNLFYQSNTQFGREYQAFFNSLGGFDIPRQFDDTNWDRVSQVGPGAPPVVADELLSFTVAAAGVPGLGQESTSAVAGPNGYVETGNIVTVTLSAGVAGLAAGDTVVIAGTATAFDGTWPVSAVLSATVFQYINPTLGIAASGGGTVSFQLTIVTTTAANSFVLGQLVKIAGAGVAGYNGTWTIRNIISNTSFAVVLNVTGLAASGGGTVSAAGSISAGRHQISVAFITRQGFITMASVTGFWNSAGSLRAIASQIPTGPANIVARLLLFTPAITAPALTGNFFSLPNGSTQIFSSAMLISDNATTTVTVDFSDTVLQAGFSANYLFSQIELGESAFNIGYNSRGVWLGERNKVSNFVNLTFDGGFSFNFLSLVNVPLGWTLDPTNGLGAASATASGLSADWGNAYAIVGDGVGAIRGLITQTAYKDYLGVAQIQSATSYSVRARVARNNTLVQGALHINLKSASGGTTAGLSVTAAQVGTSYAEFSAVITAAIASPPADLVLQVYADGTPTNNGVFLVDSIEIYPTNNPFNYSTARISHAFNPESFDSVTGQVQIRANDGQALRAGFPLRNNLYFAKDHYLCYVTDDGINEPSSWAVNEVSATIGICGPNACDWTEEWAVFAERSGLYICWGSDPVKITPEIQTDASGTGKVSWASIDWTLGHTVWVRINRADKMILVGVPLVGGGRTVFMLDYKWLDSAQDIASSPLITYSGFTGKILSHGRGRRWAVWNITANSMTFAERSDGTAQPFFGNGTANGNIYQQFDCSVQASDDGVAVPWNYQGYGCPSQVEEQMFQLSAHRKLAGYMKFRAIGVGLLPLAVSTTQRATLLRAYSLSLVPTGDGERPINMGGERFFVNIGTNTVVGSWFQLEKLVLCVRKNAAIPVRGLSA
ncbi:MAG TPA: hypothetical protein VHV32_19375 [Candidatus Angelobacter sp.]|nr:hypothetical protein [Candidatus Angelobacter sp.]